MSIEHEIHKHLCDEDRRAAEESFDEECWKEVDDIPYSVSVDYDGRNFGVKLFDDQGEMVSEDSSGDLQFAMRRAEALVQRHREVLFDAIKENKLEGLRGRSEP